jgi:hypothetical protein
VLEAGPFAEDIGSFVLHLAAEGKAASTIRNYTEAERWFAGEYLLGQTCKISWDQVDSDDVRRWMVHLLGSYSDVYGNGSTGDCSSSSSGWPPRMTCRIRWAGCAARRSPRRWCRFSPA